VFKNNSLVTIPWEASLSCVTFESFKNDVAIKIIIGDFDRRGVAIWLMQKK
jgi:hypothetical protein